MQERFRYIKQSHMTRLPCFLVGSKNLPKLVAMKILCGGSRGDVRSSNSQRHVLAVLDLCGVCIVRESESRLPSIDLRSGCKGFSYGFRM